MALAEEHKPTMRQRWEEWKRIERDEIERIKPIYEGTEVQIKAFNDPSPTNDLETPVDGTQLTPKEAERRMKAKQAQAWKKKFGG